MIQDQFLTLVGSPNSGKTTLYNWLTGARHKTVNYPGSTVELSLGVLMAQYGSPDWLVIDTPGTYSLSPKSPDEAVTARTLFEHPRFKNPPLVIAVVDATLLGRHLLLVRQLQESEFDVVVAVTMMDLLAKKGLELDLTQAEKLLGAPVVAVDGRLGGGVRDLVAVCRAHMNQKVSAAQLFKPWGEAKITATYAEIEAIEKQILKSRAVKPALFHDRSRLTEKIDRVALHPIFGLALFLLIMASLFTGIFWLAKPLMDVINDGFTFLGEWIFQLAPNSLWADFLAGGVLKGVGAVLVFVPQIAILFIGIILLEDSGYLARGATLVDWPLAKLGMNGRSFVPLLSAYACAIPAMLAARTISSRRERWLTLFIIPLMTCSARLPVYALLLSFLFYGKPAWQPGLCLAGLYFLSLFMGGVAAVIAGRFLPIRDRSLFMLELPIYRRPSFRKVAHSALNRSWTYLRRAGPTILLFSLMIWAATTFPHYELKDKSQRFNQSFAATVGHVLEPVLEPMGADWRVGVGLMSAFAAREVFVSSMAIVFNLTEEKASDEGALQSGLLASMRDAKNSRGETLFTAASVAALLVYFMVALQCMSTVVVAHRESGRWQFAAMQLVLFNAVAYLLAVVVYRTVTWLS